VICLVDNDVVYKLAACNLLEETLTALEVDRSEIYALPTAKYKFGFARSASRYSKDTLERIHNFLGSTREIESPGQLADLEILAGVVGIDSGEAVLFSVAGQYDQYLVATGDKVSLRALASTETCREIAIRVSGHVICLEQIIKRIIQRSGFAHVRGKVIPATSADTALRAVFGSGLEAVEPEVVATLDRYIQELRSLPIDLLVS
jgi:hypothetical protein